MIAEAKNAKALGFDNCAAFCVSRLLAIGKMLPAIQLDHQLGSMTYEIGDIASDRDLAPETRAVQAMIAQLGPENTFNVS